jgi:uncharacterized protein
MAPAVYRCGAKRASTYSIVCWHKESETNPSRERNQSAAVHSQLSMQASTVQLEAWIAARAVCLGKQIVFARTSAERREGLLGRKSLPPGHGFWLNPCEAIHTFGMAFPIDVVFLDRALRVRGMRSALAPKRIAICLRAESTLELPAGLVQELGILIGDKVEIRRSS